MAEAATPITFSRLADAVDEDTYKRIRRAVKPRAKHCYINALRLCEVLPEAKYCDGTLRVADTFNTSHAFNRIGDRYVDLTIEFALKKDPTKQTAAVLKEYDTQEVMRVFSDTGTCSMFERELHYELK